MKSPCKDCAERQLGCHSDCSKYKVYRMRKEKDVVNSFVSHRMDSKEKLKRARGMR